MASGFLEGKWIVFERSGPVWSRGSVSSFLGSLETSPQGGADGEHPLALLSTSPSRSRNRAPASHFLKTATPQGCSLRPYKSTNRHRMCNHFQCFCRGSFSRFGASLEGSKTSALQREHVLEQPEPQKWGQRCSGSTIRNERKRGNEASAAAGTRFGRSGSPKMRPAPQREQHFEKKHKRKPVSRKSCA